MVKGGDSCPEGRGFESQHSNVCLKNENKRKRGLVWPIFLIELDQMFNYQKICLTVW